MSSEVARGTLPQQLTCPCAPRQPREAAAEKDVRKGTSSRQFQGAQHDLEGNAYVLGHLGLDGIHLVLL